MVRILNKVPPAIVHPGLLRRLRLAARNPEMLKIFGHLPVINAGIVYLVSHPDLAALVTPKLMQEVAEASDEVSEAPTAATLIEIRCMAGALPPYPPPPIPGTDTIVPITRYADLLQEAKQQRNCLAGNKDYNRRIRDGNLYIYRVLEPERHTLAIRQSGL